MSRVATKILFDKDIRALQPKEKQYRLVVGNPKELILFVYPSGVKTFALRILGSGGSEKCIKLSQFRAGIYSVADARKEACERLRIIETSGELDSTKYLFKNLYVRYLKQKAKRGISEEYLKQVEALCERYLLPDLADLDVKDIKFSYLLDLLNAIFDPNNPQQSRLETIKRLTLHLNGIFSIALKDRYIDYNPTFGLRQEFPTKSKFYTKNGIDSRLAALTSNEILKEFLNDLKRNTTLDIQTKRAIYLQILCVNRPINTASARWSHIDMPNATWSIPANEMKMGKDHKIALNSYALKILEAQQKDFGYFGSAFVFPTFSRLGHIHRDTLSKALRNFNNSKYRDKLTTHGFRATFRTICSLHKAELLQKGISDEVIESALAHKTDNEIKFAYEREKASLEQLRILMQWYGDYLHSLCAFEL